MIAIIEKKTASEIFEEMLALFKEKSGLEISEGSDLGIRLYAAAAELESLWEQADWVLRQCFPQTASADKLDLHGELRGLERAAAERAGGIVRFYREAGEEPVSVPEGTVCLSENLLRFITTSPVEIPPSAEYAETAVRAAEGGSQYNLPAGSITAMALPPAGVSGCTNPAALSGGTDSEDDESFRRRILDSFARLPNGANAVYYETEAAKMPGVAAAVAIPRRRGRGTVDICISTTDGEASEELVAAVQSDLEAKREIAVDLQVFSASELPVDVSATIDVSSGTAEAAVAAAKTAILGFFSGGKLLGKPVYRSQLIAAIMAAEGVENVELISPAADIPADSFSLPVAGSVTVAEVAG